MDLVEVDDDYDYENGGDMEEGLLVRRNRPTIEEEEKDKLYVAVGKHVPDNESLLLWALQNSLGLTLCILHVHHPDDFIPILGNKHHCSSLEEQLVRKYRGIEGQLMLKTLDEYVDICRQFGVEAETLNIEVESIESGILQLIARHNIKKLVMGAAADDSYHKKMIDLKSKKALHVLQHAPASCQIWFICKGHLILQRNGYSQMKIHAENERSSNWRSLSVMHQSDRSYANSQELLLSEGPSYECPRPSSYVNGESTSGLVDLQLGPVAEPDHPYHLLSPRAIATVESLYVKELRKRKELEGELEKVRAERDRLREELRVARDQNSVLEGKVANYDLVVKDLEDGLISNVEQLQICEQERDNLKIECDNVLKTAEEFLNQSADAATEIDVPRFFTTLTFENIKEATIDFDPSQQLWEGESGSIYKGVLFHTPVMIKMWSPEGLQGPAEFHQEVEILSKLRHPNVVNLMGVCPDAWAIVYEYLPGGSLDERLECNDSTPPLSWKTRIGIATQLCSALIFLHSRVPQRVVHCDLKPASILLDSNFTCKISDFGFSRINSHNESSFHTEMSHTSVYMDPEFFETREVSPTVDIYSFGMILIKLLTGKATSGIKDELEDAIDAEAFYGILDDSAGDWPFMQAEQLAKLSLRCCAENLSDRPDLESVWKVLDSMRMSSGASPSYHVRDDNHQAPSHFICPIFQEVMKDPHVAADGYTYEAEALRGWLDTGHNTSPMTNLELEHTSLVPNHPLRSAIQEWMQQQ